MRAFFSSITSLLFLVAALGYAGYVIYHYRVPCLTPLSYALVGYDEHFGLSPTQIQSQLRAAAATWNEALNKKIFVEEAQVTLPVFFEYGELQQTLNSLGELEQDIDAAKEDLTRIANEYAALKKQFDEANKRGRATQAMVDELNAKASQYNALRRAINADIAEGRNLPQGETEAGLYISDKSGSRIFVYGFDSTHELQSILTHEFGHALGLNHVDDTHSVMYPTDKSEATELSKSDLAEMERACNESADSVAGRIYSFAQPLFPYLEPLATYIDAQIEGLAK
jgi:predicted Zn-dependent protease